MKKLISIVGVILGWAFTIFFFIGAMVELSDSLYVGTLFMVICSFLSCPPITKLLRTKSYIFKLPFRIIAIVSLFSVWVVISPEDRAKITQNPIVKKPQTPIEIEAKQEPIKMPEQVVQPPPAPKTITEPSVPKAVPNPPEPKAVAKPLKVKIPNYDRSVLSIMVFLKNEGISSLAQITDYDKNGILDYYIEIEDEYVEAFSLFPAVVYAVADDSKKSNWQGDKVIVRLKNALFITTVADCRKCREMGAKKKYMEMADCFIEIWEKK